MNKKLIASVGVAAIGLVALSGCSKDTKQEEQYKSVSNEASQKDVYIPKNGVEFNNYNKAQELFDNPATIIWCTEFPPNDSAPLITTPIKGKLTSSSTSYFSGQEFRWDNGTGLLGDARSADGMYHGNPPAYRFGFTPGGQYISYEGNMAVHCSTALTDFQRQNTFVSLTTDTTANEAQQKAEKALKDGDSKKAQEYLKEAIEGGVAK